jgi:epoxide hydrolase 4
LQIARNDPVQKAKSRYVRFFQIPFLPEFLIGLNRSKMLARGFDDRMRQDAFSERDLERYRIAWSQPGTLTAMINYYRAVWKKPLLPAAEYRVTSPTLVIWGKRDVYGVPELAEASVKLCVDGRIVYLDLSHWVQHDEPEQVLNLLTEFLKQ